jgi:hypothetical protein
MPVRLIPRPAPISDAHWNATLQWVEKALKRGKSLEDAASYRSAIDSGKRQLWQLETDGNITGVVITEVFSHPDGETVALPVTAGIGMARSLEAVLSTIEWWARDIGAKRLEGNGRFGWVRVLKSKGWKPVQVQIAKELS